MKLLVDSHSPLAAGTVSIRCPSYGRQGTVEGIADSSRFSPRCGSVHGTLPPG